MKRFVFIAAIVTALAAPLAPVHAAGDPARAQRLEQLFQDLKAAKDPNDGLAIEAQIVSLWMQSGDPKIDEKMGWAVAAMDSGSADLALQYLNSIIVNAPDYAEGWNKRATLYYFTGNFEGSLSDIE